MKAKIPILIGPIDRTLDFGRDVKPQQNKIYLQTAIIYGNIIVFTSKFGAPATKFDMEGKLGYGCREINNFYLEPVHEHNKIEIFKLNFSLCSSEKRILHKAKPRQQRTKEDGG